MLANFAPTLRPLGCPCTGQQVRFYAKGSESARGKDFRGFSKRGVGAKPSPERARINRARTLEAERRKKAFLKKQAQNVQGIDEIIKSRVGQPDSEEYLARQTEFAKYLTIFGRKTVRDALRDKEINFKHIHMDERLINVNSNVPRSEADPVILEILDLIRERNITLIPTDRVKIGIISKAGRQDGGIVADLIPQDGSKFLSVEDFLQTLRSIDAKAEASDSIIAKELEQISKSSEIRPFSSKTYRILALDQITTPANMGMIIRSVVASNSFDAVLVAPGGVSPNNPLVIKASAGTSLLPAKNSLKSKNPRVGPIIIQAKESMFKGLTALKEDGAEIALLAAKKETPKNWSTKHDKIDEPAQVCLWDYNPPVKSVFVIGGESAGHDPAVVQVSDKQLYIPMIPQVESLNCAVTASLVAYSPSLRNPNL